ncbi:MAG: DUF6058 family natural product biosynthesis protein [Pseudomonadota bacterium]
MPYLQSAAQRAEFQTYLDMWFCREAELAAMCGTEVATVRQLVAKGGIPGVVYRFDTRGAAWSALAAYQGLEQPECAASATEWFTPASARWVRRAVLLARAGDASAAETLKQQFLDDYIAAIESVPATLREGLASSESGEEVWDAWVRGAYAVCMRIFTAETIVDKHCRQVRAKRLLAAGELTPDELPPDERLMLHEDIEALAGFLTPFSPFERPNGTPGTVIDRGLAELGLGTENPFSATSPAPLREAC